MCIAYLVINIYNVAMAVEIRFLANQLLLHETLLHVYINVFSFVHCKTTYKNACVYIKSLRLSNFITCGMHIYVLIRMCILHSMCFAHSMHFNCGWFVTYAYVYIQRKSINFVSNTHVCIA